MLLGSLAAYGLTRFKFWGRDTITLGVLFVYIIPPILIFLPLYVALDNLGLTNTYAGGIVAHTILTLPFCLWLMQTFFRVIPPELDEAAVMDGATTLQLFRLVYLPLMLPSMVAIGIYAILLAWNEYLYAFLLLSKDTEITLPVALGNFLAADDSPWELLMTTGFIYALPPAAIYYVFKRYMVGGLTAGAVKS
jgi:multiple sugar transport system permease protein